MRTIALIIAGVLCFSVRVPFADTLRVPDPYETIQDAISASVVGDTILVAPGIYECPPGDDKIAYFDGIEDVTLISESGKELTTLHGGSVGYPIIIINCTGCRVIGFTVQNGTYTFQVVNSTGIHLSDCCIHDSDYDGLKIMDSSAYIENTRIYNSVVGIHVFYSTLDIISDVDLIANDIHSNDAYGIRVYGLRGTLDISDSSIHENGDYGIMITNTYNGPLAITGNLIYRNESAGIYFQSGASTILSHNTIAQNTSAGIHLYSAPSLLIHANIIALNEYAGLLVDSWVNPEITCNDVWGNSHFANGNYVGYITDQTGYNGNISEDPFFCFSELDDFALAENSPALDQGCGPMGAITLPGCAPHTAAVQSTWGSIKAIYKR